MKNSIVKTVLIGFLMTVFGSAAFAEMNLGLHVGVAHSDFVAYDKNNTSVKDLNFNFSALQVKDSGLALKWSGGLKFPWGENANQACKGVYDNVGNYAGSSSTSALFPAGEGFGLDFNFGIGKVLVRNEKVLVTATAVAGFVFYIASHKYKSDLADNDDKIETTAMGGKFGADLTGIIHLTQKVGLYANFGLYYTVSSYNTKKELHVADTTSFSGYKKEESSDGTVFNGCTFAPSLGVSITF
ncbi:hypothetical protein [Treponema sp.]|uniref:hypothetical protein n=1 Tax=Treponema sp. TaxID=166 RepID=UPI0025E0FBAE|nr:hypothetical protein [Treponema sp.]MBR4323756.1 hypothetical protein [Treponema sp.]